ncbi:MAG: GspE/PulE family protein, partial [Fimbriiglobus sp.]
MTDRSPAVRDLADPRTSLSDALTESRVEPRVEYAPPPSRNGMLENPPSFAGDRDPNQTLGKLIEYAAALKASDMFCHTNEDHVEFAIRHHGILRPVGQVPSELGRRCVALIKTMAEMNISERRKPLDGRWQYNARNGPLDLRVSTIPTLHGEDCTIRILDRSQKLLAISEIGLDPDALSTLTQLLATPSGLILVSGPTETGKSTTLYSCLAHLNTGERKVSTIEDPIEYSLKGVRQSPVSPSTGLTFDVQLKAVLRQAPNVIMIGEIRDAETAQLAARAAATGHLVLSTLHSPVASAAVHSMTRFGIPPTLLAHSLLGVISQRLLRTLCPVCKVG